MSVGQGESADRSAVDQLEARGAPSAVAGCAADARSAPGAARFILWAAAATLVSRLVFLFWTQFAIESDEAVVGLMARHIAQFREAPVWYYGQEYMGALEAWAAAPFVGLIGGPVAIKLTALFFAVVFVAAAAAMAREVFGRGRAALFTVGWLVLGPLLLTLWTLKLRGGFVSVLALGQLILLIAYRQGTRRATVAGGAALGLLAGLGLWLNLLIAPFVFAAGLFLLVRPRFLFRLRAVGAALAGAVVGSAPFWLYQLRHHNATLHFLLDGKGNLEVASHVRMLLQVHVPTLLGVLAPWRVGPIPVWGWAVLALFALASALLLARAARGIAALVVPQLRPTNGAELYVLTAAGFLLCAIFSRFGAEPEPRYAIVLYVFLAPAVGALLGPLWDRGGAPRAGAVVVAAALLGVSLASTYGVDRRLPTQPLFCIRDNTLTPLDQSALYRYLDVQGVDALYAEYWMGYRIIYETGERIVTVPGRYGPYTDRFRAARRRGWLYRNGGPPQWQWRKLVADLDKLGVGHRDALVDGYQVVVPTDFGLPRESWTLRASVGSEPRLVTDGEFATRWTTTAVQQPGQWLEVDLGATRSLDAVSADFGAGDAPARLKLEIAGEDGEWSEVGEFQNVPEKWRAEVGRPARKFRLVQTGSMRDRWWSVNELFAFGR